MRWTPIIHTIFWAGFLAPMSILSADTWGEDSISTHTILIEQLNPDNRLFQDIPLIPIADLLANPGTYHGHTIILRGSITRLELHVDESTLFIDYVFWLKDGDYRVLVFGRHDRTSGDIQMVTDRVVEVRGLFWKERFVNGYRLENNLEAQQVRFFPSLNPDRA